MSGKLNLREYKINYKLTLIHLPCVAGLTISNYSREVSFSISSKSLCRPAAFFAWIKLFKCINLIDNPF